MNGLALFIFPMLMAYAASSDMLTMRISNKVILLLTGGFFAVAFLINMPFQDLGAHVGAALMVLVVAFTFFAFGWIGGGDAKLAAATTLWLGFGFTLPYVVYSALLGGALTLGILMLRRLPLPFFLAKIDWIARLHHEKTGIPYGIALACAGLLIYSDTAVFTQLIS